MERVKYFYAHLLKETYKRTRREREIYVKLRFLLTKKFGFRHANNITTHSEEKYLGNKKYVFTIGTDNIFIYTLIYNTS